MHKAFMLSVRVELTGEETEAQMLGPHNTGDRTRLSVAPPDPQVVSLIFRPSLRTGTFQEVLVKMIYLLCLFYLFIMFMLLLIF